MPDKYWLNQDVIESTAARRFYIGGLTKEDAVSLNLRDEIVTYFHATLSDTAEAADVILTIAASPETGFEIRQEGGKTSITATNNDDLLHGFYYEIMHRYIGDLPEHVINVPSQAVRMLNHWDNFDGTIERGYSGRSIFYEADHFRGDVARIEAYARMLASVGLNAISLNNVNVKEKETFFITGAGLQHVRNIAAIFTRFGIKTFLSVNFAAPLRFEACDTADPLDKNVQAWWADRAKEIYDVIPDFGGFLVKADSEGQPGPFYYGRDHPDGANMLAKALAPFGGIVIWRAFVYNSEQDWRDRSIDRAKAAYDHFMPLDGKFADNVILQIKFGPIDFQPREPVQPLFGQLEHTNLLIEFQVTQEYTGHQIDTNFLATQWTHTLAYDTKPADQSLLLRDVPRTTSPNPALSGIAAVSSIGRDENWTGNKLMQANVYAFGRLGWQSDLTDTDILREWTALTFKAAKARMVVEDIMSRSNQDYANYTAPLGVGFMVKSSFHYGPGINDYEFDRWGTYHYADRDGLGDDRTLATGTGYTRQYSDANFATLEDVTTCPDEFLLFYHHVAYTHVLQSGETVIQHIYNTHFEGYQAVQEYITAWQQLKGLIDPVDFDNVTERLQLQLTNAHEWCDQINTYFHRLSGIADDKGRRIYN